MSYYIRKNKDNSGNLYRHPIVAYICSQKPFKLVCQVTYISASMVLFSVTMPHDYVDMQHEILNILS